MSASAGADVRTAPPVEDAGVTEEGRTLWRVGRHYPIHVYEGDRPVATFFRAEDAALAVASVGNGVQPAAEGLTRAFAEHLVDMDENVIPAIVKGLTEQQRAAAELRYPRSDEVAVKAATEAAASLLDRNQVYQNALERIDHLTRLLAECKVEREIAWRAGYIEAENNRSAYEAADGMRAAALAGLPGQTWRTMDSAPRDGTEVDLWADGRRVTDAHYHCGEWLHWYYGGQDIEPGWRTVDPTHWQPLPAPPLTPAGEG